MKKFIKKGNRKGFTLVETMLAVFILVVISTMLINGFVTTMAYSYQTSVYSKSGANNYKGCMTQLARWNHLDTNGADGREAMAYNNTISSNAILGKELTFYSGGVVSNSLETVNVAIIERKDLSATVPDELNYGSKNYAPNNESRADNHKTFVYYPEYCAASDGSHVGDIIVMYVQSEDKYYWVIDNGMADLSGATKVTETPIH